jgi:tetratricopeptide (TPR) repeat protein
MDNSDKTRAMNAPPSIPPTAQNAASASDSMSTVANDLVAAASQAQAKAVESVDLGVPEFRESSPQEIRQAEQLLREANLARRRENYSTAEAKCREALALVPKDAVALEMLGDLMQGVARINEAMAAYRRAVEADPARSSAERKYADLLVRQQHWTSVDQEALPKNPWFSVLLSLLLPGAGQIYNGELKKGVVLLLGIALCFLGWSIGSNASAVGSSAGGATHSSTTHVSASQISQSLNPKTMIPIALGGLLYIYAVADANSAARRGKGARKLSGGKTGWEV